MYHEYEYMGSSTKGVALESMTRNPAYVTNGGAVTSFSSGMEAGNGEEDHTYEEMPFEANEEEQGDITHGIQQDTTHSVQGSSVEGGQDGADEEVYI